MKPHTSDFKNNINKMGRQIKNIITYGGITLEEELYAVTPHYDANLLKSVMKQLDIECSINIPKNTVLNYQFGLKVGNNYEYLDFGNYVVYSSEKQEDTNTYKIICYDKMLYSMKHNENLGVTYPITIKNYLTALATKIGLTLKTGTFINESMTISQELYVGLDYTYRDILDEIAQATGSNIVINNNDELEVRYFTNTQDTINEDFLKDINVSFGEKYGPINSIVLSRSAGSDNVYIRDDESIDENGLCEIKISDNQIMNFNDRSDYLQGLLNALDGLYYYINDFSSTGICYYDVCDLYNISIGETIYQCAMLNDEIAVTLGIEELIHTDMPEQSETDYSKADKTDRKLNETYLIVDKQNQTIESVVSNVTEQDAKISRIEQSVDGIESTVIASIGSINLINNSTFSHIDSEGNYDLDYWKPDYLYRPQEVTSIDDKTWLNFEVTTDSGFAYKSDGITQEKIKPINDGETYTFQVLYQNLIIDDDTKTTRDTRLFLSINLYDENNTYLRAFFETFNVDFDVLERERLIYTFTVPSNINCSYCNVHIYTPTIWDEEKYFKARITNVMLEKGSSASDWIPSQVDYYNTTKSYSQIVQKVNSIEARVEDNEENISELQITAEGLTSTVSSKVGNNEVISKINQSSESITINANRISLARKNYKYDI